jgi:23S rRNA pseudouridine1911/1915/1917 synthase
MKQTQTDPNISIIYEDEHLLLIDKPAGLLSQEDHTGDANVLTLCRQYLGRSQTNHPFLGLIHRLDRPVSGLMLLAKNRNAADYLSKQVRNRTIQKTYWAVTAGSPPRNGVLTHRLYKNRDTNIVKVVSGSHQKGKQAELSFAKLEESDDLHLLSVHLQTGRPHQIRVQLSHEGYPIWGDYKYGHSQPDGRTMALRAVELVFKHPKTNQHLHFELAPPREHPWTQFSIAHQ